MSAKIGQNAPCWCGSGRKYKKCFHSEKESRASFDQRERQQKISEHNAREEMVFAFFSGAVEDCKIALFSKDNPMNNAPRLQMLVIFTLIDVFSNYWNVYLDSPELGTKVKFVQWHTTFCRVSENEEYKQSDLWKSFSVQRLYELRCSIAHFLGLSGIQDTSSFALMSSDMPDAELKKFKKECGRGVIMIRPVEFYSLVRSGGLLMLEKWASIIKDARNDRDKEDAYISGMKRIFDKIMEEGAKRVAVKKSKYSLSNIDS